MLSRSAASTIHWSERPLRCSRGTGGRLSRSPPRATRPIRSTTPTRDSGKEQRAGAGYSDQRHRPWAGVAAADGATDGAWQPATGLRPAQRQPHRPCRSSPRTPAAQPTINTNGLSEAVAHVIDQGSYFYTMTYTPTNTATDGKYRKIQVKLAQGEDSGDKLAYRRGYYAADTKEAKARSGEARRRPAPSLHGPGHAQTRPRFRSRSGCNASRRQALRPAVKPASLRSTLRRDNPNLKAPLTRYRVDFVIAASGLELDANPDGSRHGKIEATLLVYDHEGRRSTGSSEPRPRYGRGPLRTGQGQRRQLQPGNRCSQQWRPSLRSGVFDLNANLAGTLEVPLSKRRRSAPQSHL